MLTKVGLQTGSVFWGKVPMQPYGKSTKLEPKERPEEIKQLINQLINSVSDFPLFIDTTLLPYLHYLPRSVRSEREIQITSSEINKLFSKGALEVTEHSDNEIISDICLRDNKKDGSHGMILNLKKLNMYAAKTHFKMEDCFMASIDLKDAYYSVPITREDRKYLRFLWQGTLFQFTCLPNALSCAPRKFTKLHLRGHILV